MDTLTIRGQLPTNIQDYRPLLHSLKTLPLEQAQTHLRNLARIDLYFLLRYLLHRPDIEHPWLFERCREVQNAPNGYLDLWSREHYKSTIITFAKTIQDILASHGENPLPEWGGMEPTFVIFSHSRPISKGFLRQIKREFENNEELKGLFPDVLYPAPEKQAPKWSEDDGLIVRRKTNPKEATVEAWGLVDAQPTSKHFYVRIYDDVVTLDSVRSPDMIVKTTESWEISLNLGVIGGHERYIGTRWHFNDTYREMMARKAVIPRIHTATVDGELEGEPVFWTREQLLDKRRKMGPYNAAAQLFQNPKVDSTQGFKRDWLRFYHGVNNGTGMNRYMLVDPANEKKKRNDYTAIWVIGLGADENYYALDMVRDRLGLTERADLVFRLHRKWKPRVVGYEKYSMQADIDHIQDRQQRENYRFDIVALGGNLQKHDRIRRLIPIFEENRVYLPEALHRTVYDGRTLDLVETFINEEYDPFPVPVHDDMLDALARILDEELCAQWPDANTMEKSDRYKPVRRISWMGR